MDSKGSESTFLDAVSIRELFINRGTLGRIYLKIKFTAIAKWQNLRLLTLLGEQYVKAHA